MEVYDHCNFDCHKILLKISDVSHVTCHVSCDEMNLKVLYCPLND